MINSKRSKIPTACSLIQEIRACTLCKDHLPLGPNPICTFSADSKILIVGQAPGTKVHHSGIAWNDPSGNRLRDWLAVDREDFYNTGNFAIVPMGFCYPGKGKSGDLPPRPECADTWMHRVLVTLERKKLTILIGKYAQHYFLRDRQKNTLTETVRNWREYSPDYFVLPHPSPRNNIWLRKNPWFTDQVIPRLQNSVQRVIGS